MLNLLKTGLLSLTGLSLVATSAIANPSKWTNGGREYVVFDNLPAGERIEVFLNNQDATRRVEADACGWLKLSETSTYPIATNVALSSDGGLTYGADISLGSLPTYNVTCNPDGTVTAGGVPTSSPTMNFIDGRGRRIIPNQTPGMNFVVRYNGIPQKLNRSANDCGYVQLTASDRTDLSSFTYNGTNYSLASLSNQAPPVCRTINGQQVRYQAVP